jgi:hypothetical protein
MESTFTSPRGIQSSRQACHGCPQGRSFSILLEIDVRATMKARLDLDVIPYRALDEYNPPLAQRDLAAEPDSGLRPLIRMSLPIVVNTSARILRLK